MYLSFIYVAKRITGLIATIMAVKVFLFALCSISAAIAGEYGLHELPLISPQHFHEDFSGHNPGGEHTNEDSSLAHEYIDEGNYDVHTDVTGHSFQQPTFHSTEESFSSHDGNYIQPLSTHVSDGDENFEGHLSGANSYVNMKGHDGEKMEYFVDHSNGVSSSHGGADNHQSYQHFGDAAHEAVSTSSFKDFNKGTSYTVKQTHGHKGLASVTRKSHGQEHETEVIHGDYGHSGQVHDVKDSGQSDIHSYEFSQHSIH